MNELEEFYKKAHRSLFCFQRFQEIDKRQIASKWNFFSASKNKVHGVLQSST